MNAFDKVICIILAAVLMFLFPIMYLAQKQDAINQLYVTEQTAEFTNEIKNHGYLTENMYTRFEKKLRATGNVYSIKITHGHTVFNPIYDAETGEFQDDYYTYQECIYTDDILNTIYNNKLYYFRQGDSISVEVININKTLSSTLLNNIGVNHVGQIHVNYGGIIRDENY